MQHKGKLIAIEGTDGSGKSTQFRLACARFRDAKNVRCIQFPRYDQPSAALLKMYLNGDFGTDPESVNPYAASTFFAVDRYASFKTDWGAHYQGGGAVLCDRYTTSNAIHQAGKLPKEAQQGFVSWLFDFEYRLLGLPKPDCVIFLDMPVQHALALLQNRQGDGGDIHERDHAYMAHCRESARALCDQYGWHKIDCVAHGNLRAAEDIHREIYTVIQRVLGELDA